jgi:hypothetical protein
MKNVISFAAVLIMLLAPIVATAAAEYEVPIDGKASDILPADKLSGPHYQIQDRVVCFGYMNQFTVNSDYGTFEPSSDYALRKLLKEIQAIAVLREIKESKVYLDSVKNAAKMPFEFGKNIITDPVDTISGVPKGVFRLFSNIGTAATNERNPSEDARWKTLLLLSSYKRDYAYELGVDVYSSNPVLQKELNSVGWAGAAGSLSVSAALTPFGGPGFMAVKMTRLSQQFNNLLKTEPAPRLRQLNGEKLAAMGVAKELADQFLDHDAFTPTHQTIIVGSLALLTNARGQAAFITLALTAADEESANFFQNMAETMRGFNESVSPLQDIIVASGLVFAKAKNGSVMIPFPLDRGVWTERAAGVIPNAIASYKKATGTKLLGKVELWVTGTATPLAKKEAAKLGVDVVENVDQKIEFMY